MQVFEVRAQGSITMQERRCSWWHRKCAGPSNDKSVQCDLLEAIEDKEVAERPKMAAKRPVMCDVSCQTEYDMTNDEPAEAAALDPVWENPDAKFHPLTLKHQGVFTNLQGMCRQSMIIALMLHFVQ